MDIYTSYYLFAIACVLHGFIDYIDFKRPRNSGFFSIKTEGDFWRGDKVDAWHLGKILMWGCISVAVAGISWWLLLFAFTNIVLHDALLHSWD